jgi:hypothetical protein
LRSTPYQNVIWVPQDGHKSTLTFKKTDGGQIVTFSVAVPAAPMKFAHERYLGAPSCPKCGALIAAAEASHYLGRGHIRNMWLCDDCDYDFFTDVKLAD